MRVWDSTAEVRYLVIPQRPEGTEGMDEEALMDLVTRDSMIGTGLARGRMSRVHDMGGRLAMARLIPKPRDVVSRRLAPARAGD